MGRSPCCDKVGLKKGPWTPEEDQKLLAYIEEHGHGSWRALPSKAGLQRCGKSCRLRWTNYLRPDIKRGKFSLQEEQTIIQLHALLGNRWSAIATHLPKRTDNEIKNYWNTHLKKRLAKMGIDPVSHKPKNDTLLSNDGQSKSTANLSHMAQWESARLEAEARLVKQSKLQAASPLPNQAGSAEPSPTSDKLLASANGPPPRCLDILKAWNGFWSSKPSDVGIADLESPTSTLSTTGAGESSSNFFEFVGGNSSGSCDDGTAREECEEEWEEGMDNSVPITSGFNDLITTPSMDNTWTAESLKSDDNNHEHMPSGNFLESFTDLLLSTSGSNDRANFAEGGGDSDIGLACNGSGSGSGSASGSGDVPSGSNNNYFEDNNKSYWNNILNLVNSSPSDSPMF